MTRPEGNYRLEDLGSVSYESHEVGYVTLFIKLSGPYSTSCYKHLLISYVAMLQLKDFRCIWG
jgi:hypothetical protein